MQLLNLKESTKTIALIASAGKKLDERIHAVAVSGLAHFLGIDNDGEGYAIVNDGGDLTALTQLCHAMPKSARGNALKYWITKHLPVKWEKKAYGGKGGWKKNGTVDLDNAISLLESAIESPFYDKEDTEQAAFDANKYLNSVANKLRKEMANGADVDVIDFIAKLQEKLAA